MRGRRRRLLPAALTLCAAGAGVVAFGTRRADTVTVYIGSGTEGGRSYTDGGRWGAAGAYLKGERDSLRRLALELDRYPRAVRLIVRMGAGWESWLLPDDMDRAWTQYDRSTGRLHDHVMGGNVNASWSRVTDDAIRAVAATSGMFGDLRHFGCKDVRP